jgi:lycopene cyclase domain-containing protein
VTAGPTAYLVHLLVWTLPVLGLQILLLAWVWGHRIGALLRAVLPPPLVVSAWLVLGDHLAISAGVWQFGAGKHLGLRLGAVPVEEVLFFLITNLLVAFGLALFTPRRTA